MVAIHATVKPSFLKHCLCASMKFWQFSCPFCATHSSRCILVSGQEQQIFLPEYLITGFQVLRTLKGDVHKGSFQRKPCHGARSNSQGVRHKSSLFLLRQLADQDLPSCFPLSSYLMGGISVLLPCAPILSSPLQKSGPAPRLLSPSAVQLLPQPCQPAGKNFLKCTNPQLASVAP
mmetsp:Transcript_41642/g.64983  ORF Transcript_41642/g.64983 Transcript_41642/m.64983 type:complete len:176 (-) Transcript_41642:129-656(-)